MNLMKFKMKKNLLLLLIILLNACTTTTDSNATKTKSVVPLAPTNLTGKGISTTEINLTWTDNSTNELGFKVERKTGSGTYSVIGTTTSNELIFNDSNLIPSTTYTYRVCSYNNTGNSLTYSSEITVTTNTPITKPVITTTTPSSITKNSAISGGNISSDGGAAITARGIVWGTATNPTIANTTKTVDGIGTGIFSSNLQNLTPSTTIYARAYATNSAGTSYGNEVKITTLASLKIGDEYQGGIIYHIFSPDDWTDDGFYVPGEIHGLIVAKNDLPDKYEYGCYNKYFNTLGHTQLTVGYHSEYPTVEIFNYCGANTAAGVCYNLNLNGYSDWYLPTYQELKKIFQNKIINPDGKIRWSCTWQNYFPDNSVPNNMNKYAYAYDFVYGSRQRSELFFVRPVRKF
ncbi:MAG: hypothetical protein RL311_1212 [Bacteroidota bacterium]|jgi:hypothetical protein